MKFLVYLRKDRARVEKLYDERLKGLVDEVKVKKSEETLHPGFEKICGLKGSKLSGG